jgi:hypothetical protein
MKVSEIIVEVSAPGASGIKNSLAGGAAASPLRKVAGAGLKFKHIFTRIDYKRKALGSASTRWSAKMASRLGPWMMLLKIIGVGAACYEFWDDMGIAEQLYIDGEIEDDAELERFRQFYTGVFMAQIIVPAVARAIINSRYVVWIAKFITRIVGLGTGVVTAGASVAALIATEAFFAWFQWWLGTEKAKNWLSDELLEPLILLGKIPESAWSSLTGYYEKADTKRVAAGKPSGKSKDNTDWAGSVQPKVPPVTINGVRVTDSDGYVLPNADLNPAVKAALMDPNSAEAKKFAAIPKRPSGGAADQELGYANKINPTMAVDPATGKLVPAA